MVGLSDLEKVGQAIYNDTAGQVIGGAQALGNDLKSVAQAIQNIAIALGTGVKQVVSAINWLITWGPFILFSAIEIGMILLFIVLGVYITTYSSIVQ